MSSEITSIGFTCKACGNRVVVLRSSTPPREDATSCDAQCACGFQRHVRIDDLQKLEVWHDVSPTAEPSAAGVIRR